MDAGCSEIPACRSLVRWSVSSCSDVHLLVLLKCSVSCRSPPKTLPLPCVLRSPQRTGLRTAGWEVGRGSGKPQVHAGLAAPAAGRQGGQQGVDPSALRADVTAGAERLQIATNWMISPHGTEGSCNRPCLAARSPSATQRVPCSSCGEPEASAPVGRNLRPAHPAAWPRAHYSTPSGSPHVSTV